MCLTENGTLLIRGLDLTLQPVILWVFWHKLAGLKSLTNHRIPSSELLFTFQRELLHHMGMFKKNSPCDVECVYLALLSRLAFTCFMWWLSCWERKCSDTDCLSTACLWLQGNLSLNMLNTQNPIPLDLFYWCNCCMSSYSRRMFKHQRIHLGFVRPENFVSFSCFCCRRRSDFVWIS